MFARLTSSTTGVSNRCDSSAVDVRRSEHLLEQNPLVRDVLIDDRQTVVIGGDDERVPELAEGTIGLMSEEIDASRALPLANPPAGAGAATAAAAAIHASVAGIAPPPASSQRRHPRTEPKRQRARVRGAGAGSAADNEPARRSHRALLTMARRNTSCQSLPERTSAFVGCTFVTRSGAMP
jgi:hypothetical protein